MMAGEQVLGRDATECPQRGRGRSQAQPGGFVNLITKKPQANSASEIFVKAISFAASTLSRLTGSSIGSGLPSATVSDRCAAPRCAMAVPLASVPRCDALRRRSW